MDVNNSGQVHNVTVPRLKDDQMIMIHPLHVRSRMMYSMYLPESSCWPCACRFFCFLWPKAF